MAEIVIEESVAVVTHYRRTARKIGVIVIVSPPPASGNVSNAIHRLDFEADIGHRRRQSARSITVRAAAEAAERNAGEYAISPRYRWCLDSPGRTTRIGKCLYCRQCR